MMNHVTHRFFLKPCFLMPGRGVRLLAFALLLAVLAPAVEAQRRNDPLANLDRDQRRVFQAYTRLFCAQFFRYERDRYVILPNHYVKRENSTGRSYDQVKEMMTEVRRERRGLTTVEVKVYPPEAEVIAAAKVLPAMDVGHYGYLSQVQIKEIVGPEEMIVTNIELIPEEVVGTEKNAARLRLAELQQSLQYQTYRVLGFRTKGLAEGQVYKGPGDKGLHVAVMSTGREHAFVLVNYDKLDRVRTHEFPDVLDYVKLSPLAFIDMVRDNRERLQSKGDQASLISIYRRFYSRYRPARVSEGPRVARPQPESNPEPQTGTHPDEPDAVGGGDDERRVEPRPQEPDEPERRADPPARDKPEPGDTTPDPPEEEADPQEDDWEYEEEEASGEVEFFGIPLGG